MAILQISRLLKFHDKWGVGHPVPSIPVIKEEEDEFFFELKPKFERTDAAFEFNQD